MTGRWIELVLITVGAMGRATLAWSAGLALLVGATVAFWPAFRGSSDLSSAFDQMPSGLVDALGLNDIGTPAGFLRGNLYAFLIPILMIGAAVALAIGQTASEESSGRLEIFLTQPVSRTTFWLARCVAVIVSVSLLALAVLIVQVATDAIFDLSISAYRVTATATLCALLAMLHAGIALAVAAAVPRPAAALGTALGIGIAGYLVVAMFPLVGALEPWQHVSPWDWALGGDPLVNAANVWRYAALILPTALLIGLGAWRFGQRDVRSA